MSNPIVPSTATPKENNMTTTTNTETYDRLKSLCISRGKPAESKKVQNNTWVEHVSTDSENDAYAVRLHSTQVLVAWSDGSVMLQTGGWFSMTTKERMHHYLPSDVSVSSRKGEWNVSRTSWVYGPATDAEPWGTSKRTAHWDVTYADGIVLDSVGGALVPRVGTYPTEDAAKAAKIAKAALRRDVKNYVHNVQVVLDAWSETLRNGGHINTGGDCFYCQGLVTSMSGERVSDNGHLWSHLRENYLPACLLLAAAKGDERVWTWVAYGFRERIQKILTTYFMNHLTSSPEVATTDHFDASLLEAAAEALTMPSDFGYFGDDESLWVTSAPTYGRNRDSENTEVANFEAVCAGLSEQFPDLVENGEVTKDQRPGGVYIFGASHWASGWIEQVVVPVLKNGGQITRENIHPAFVAVMEYVRSAQQYPLLPGAEKKYAELEAEDAAYEQQWERENADV